MSSEFGKLLRVSVFGESHGKGVGAVVDGLPAGERVDMDALMRFMARRRPGASPLSTARREADVPVIVSGLREGKTCGSPLCVFIENTDARSGDYAAFADTPRPSHADYTAHVKWQGAADMRGGGHFSGRLTAPLCAAGGIALQILARREVYVGAHLAEVALERDEAFPLFPGRELFEALAAKPFPVLDDASGARMQARIREAAAAGDSVGGVIECAAAGLRAGLGNPMFGGVENRLASAIFGIPGLKGIEFGAGFTGARMRGSAHNDPFVPGTDGAVCTATNHSGGILGGITNGMPLCFRVCIKPTASIAMEQDSVRLSTGRREKLEIRGRHDPCIAHRAIPAVEAVTALVLLDLILEG